MNTTKQALDTAAANLAAETGCSIEVARAGVRIEMAKIAVAFGRPLEEVNAYLAAFGLSLAAR